MARVLSVGGTVVTPLAQGWHVAAATAGRIVDPAALDGEKLDWCPAVGPSTAASAFRGASRWTFEDRVDFDAGDWWWRCRFRAPATGDRSTRVLRFGGLATLAEVWLNGTRILQSANMFLEHEVDVGALLREDNDLVLCCRALNAALQARRPRPRWKTRLVETQQLRWFRTTLLGRIPGWTPPAAPVGPWRAVVIEERTRLSVIRADARARMEGSDGAVDMAFALEGVNGSPPEKLVVQLGTEAIDLRLDAGERAGHVVARGTVRMARPERWQPHTHGAPMRYPLRAEAWMSGRATSIDLGSVGFRTVDIDGAGEGFALRVNGANVFCRGACWTPVDAVALVGPPSVYRAALEAVRTAGMNMVRVCGPFFYEEDAFYDLCSELGILVWQDFPFANMDYPADDPAFVAIVDREARGFLDRTQLDCCVAVLCGNSEVEQQAAMMGAPRESWRSPLFAKTLADVSRDLRPDVPYWPSTPTGSDLPFLTDRGTAHYFGVGAYLRPLEDARRAGVRFVTECLAFANVPEEAMIDELLKGGGPPPQDPLWKRRVPRDRGVGWDFDDVRDHYLRALFGVDPLALRYADVDRYIALSRVVTGEVMASTFAEWRRVGSSCTGALVWFLRDLWPGAGWGLLDADGQPKAAYHYLRRCLRPLAVLLVDEGLNGLDAHILNDGPEPFKGELDVALFRDGDVRVARGNVPIEVAGGSGVRVRVAGMFDYFIDTTYAYRFGPLAHDLAVAALVDATTGKTKSEAFHFLGALPSERRSDIGLEAVATPAANGSFSLALGARRFAQSVALQVPGFSPDDDYFHVAPGSVREVILRPRGGAQQPLGTAQALNAHSPTKISVVK